jgi:predicted proteasome-type protease
VLIEQISGRSVTELFAQSVRVSLSSVILGTQVLGELSSHPKVDCNGRGINVTPENVPFMIGELLFG